MYDNFNENEDDFNGRWKKEDGRRPVEAIRLTY